MPSNIISLSDHISKRNAPDPNCISRDADGNPLFKFSYVYRHMGRRFSVDVWAHDWADAEARLSSIKSGAWLEGMIVAEDHW